MQRGCLLGCILRVFPKGLRRRVVICMGAPQTRCKQVLQVLLGTSTMFSTHTLLLAAYSAAAVPAGLSTRCMAAAAGAVLAGPVWRTCS